MNVKGLIGCLLFLTFVSEGFAQDSLLYESCKGKLNVFLSKTCFNANFGAIHYPYNNSHLSGSGTFNAERTVIPRLAGRGVIGYRFNRTFSMHYSVLRAAIWPYYEFKNTDGSIEKRGVWTNLWGLTLKAQTTILNKWNVFGETGLGLLSRNGFKTLNGLSKVTDENYFTILNSIGATRKLRGNWEGIIMLTYSPPNKIKKQPYTAFASLGFIYNMSQLKPEKIKRNCESSFIWPKQLIQLGYSSNILGFTSHKLFSIGDGWVGLPIFWKGAIQAQQALIATYQKNVFHGKRIFSIDWGTSFTIAQTELNKTAFFAISIYPILRFWFLRNNYTDNYVVYSIVGPTYFSKKQLDDLNTGEHITYQDYLGIGTFFGKNRRLNSEIKIVHFSNGNIFAVNPGIDVPLTLSMGYSF